MIALVVHGGAGPDSEYIQQNEEQYKQALNGAADVGYRILQGGGTALDAVEAAVNFMEDHHLFNAGRGSALNDRAEVEMDAAIMDGHTLKSGAVAIVKSVKNPVTLARTIMDKSKHIFLGSAGALEFAKKQGLMLMPDAYFITDHAFEQFQEAQKDEPGSIEETIDRMVRSKSHGTVGAVALDENGNLAAATSTGGTENKTAGRIADSSMTGVGTYANNDCCAISCTGDGEYIMKHVLAFNVSSIVRLKGLGIKEACHHLIHEQLKNEKGDMGIIAISTDAEIAMEFNSERMHRAWRTSNGDAGASVYK